MSRYWHGGPGIDGARILPPSVTGCGRVTNDPYVYVTPLYSLALMYAASCDGWVYEVIPAGPIEQDPDSSLPSGDSLRCSSAGIVRRVRPPRRELERAAAAMRQSMSWLGGTA